MSGFLVAVQAILTTILVAFWLMVAYDYYDNDCKLTNTETEVKIECIKKEEE